MSMNNQIFITKSKDKFKVYDCCADEGPESKSFLESRGCSLEGEYDDLEKALLAANKIESEYGVTYLGRRKNA